MNSIKDHFTPLNSEIYSDKNRWETTQIGRKIGSHTLENFPDLNKAEIAIFNVPEYEGSKNSGFERDCKIRDLFYSFHLAKTPVIVDLGYLRLLSSRKDSFKTIELVCEYFLNSGIIPFVIGGGNDISYAMYKSYSALEKYVSLTSVDNKFDIGLEDDNLASFSHLGKIISHKPSYLFHYTNLAYQSYLVSSIAVEMLQAMNFDAIRLGDLRANFSEVEPIMRNTDFLSFDISAIQHAYAAANVYSSPNGLNGMDACKIMRYAGLSDKITSVGIFEYNQSLDLNNQSAYLIAEMLWHFVDGYNLRKNELHPKKGDCTKYTVTFEDGKNEISFYKSQISGRWWMGVPFEKEGLKDLQTYYVACSYSDYEITNKGEIPDRWLKTLNKFI